MNNEELLRQIEDVQDDLDFLNAQIRSVDKILEALEIRRGDAGVNFDKLMAEAKTRGLIAKCEE